MSDVPADNRAGSRPGSAGPAEPSRADRAGSAADPPVDESRIFIGPDGQVTIENLTPELLGVALELDDGDRRLKAIAAALASTADDPGDDGVT